MDDSAVRSGSPEELTKTPPTERAPADDDATRAPDDTATQPSVDAQHPWLGLASFTEETRAYFYGREDEVAELVRRVQRKTLTLLFGQSGLGKTSILRAGIVPWLRPTGYSPVYVRIDYSRESPPPSEQIKQAIFRATLESGQWTQTGVAVAGESLWEFLHHRDDILHDESGKTLIPLLIFDQFEEIFTLAQSDDFGRKRAAEFIEDLADLVENRAPKALEARIEQDESAAERFDFTRSDYRILIALREDYLAHLEALKSAMPSITQNRMRLARMTGEQALSAVLKPGGKLVSVEVAEAIVRFIAGGSELRNAEVEPSLLSLICRELNNARIAQGRAEISADLLAGSHDTILAEFYERALADQPQAVRRFIEDELVTESGFRESIAEERVRKAFAAAGARPDALAVLVDRRLLRIEERLDVRRVELTHDVLCSVVRASRDLRHEREARDEAERKLAEQRARERATRKALVRARQIAAVCAVLAVGALASAAFGFLSMKRAQLAEAQALQTRAMAESARGEAEKLIVYLLDDFYLELEPVGRLDIVAGLSKRALDYYDALPKELRTAETDRNRALALVRYGAALRTQSRLDESQKALSEAVDVLAKLRQQGDGSEATAIGLGTGLMSEARVSDSLNKRFESRQFAQQAADVLRPLMASSPSVPLRRAYGLVMTYLGFSQARDNQEEAAVKTLDEAREAYRSIDGLKLDDLPSAVAYAEASAWQMDALRSLGRFDQVRKVGEEAARVAGQVMEKRPGQMSALRARALILDNLATTEAFDLHQRKALALSEQGARDWEAILKLDPSNQIAWNNLASARMTSGFLSLGLGQIRDAQEHWRQALAVERHVKEAAMLGNVLSLAAGYLTMLEADLGNRQAAEAALRDNRRLTEIAVRNLPADSFGQSFVPEFQGWYGFPTTGMGYGGYALPLAAADYDSVRGLARASARRIEQIKNATPEQELDKNRMLEVAYRTAAEASYRLKDYAAADADIKRALEVGRAVPKRMLVEERDANAELMLAAMVAARLNRLAEAQKIIEPVLKFHRRLYARGKDNEDLSQHVELAQALYVSALAAPGQKTAQLTEAAAILDGLPPMMRHQISVTVWRDRIAEEQKTRR
jgi:tetratricopeptide (TPR) repeat protein